MIIILLLIPLSLIILGIAIAIFFWAMKHKQFENLDMPSQQILFDDKQQRQQDDD